MGLSADLRALAAQVSAPLTVRYGEGLRFAGSDLPAPTRVRVPTRHGRVRVDVYRPRVEQDRAPAYVHLHGGAFVMRHPRMDDFFARWVASECDAVVLNVDYDVAPQARYPVAQHQAYDVLAWLAAHPDRLGTDPARIAVGGFSAGGNLAASAALQAVAGGVVRPVLQLLGVPSLDVAEDVDAKVATAPGAMIGPSLLRLVRATYFKDAARRTEPFASPLLAPHLTGVAPAVVVTAERDVLRREGDAYAARLAAAGVAVDHLVVAGADHYFLEGPRPRDVLERLAGALRTAYAAGAGRT